MKELQIDNNREILNMLLLKSGKKAPLLFNIVLEELVNIKARIKV
jgi:hypothetical protein